MILTVFAELSRRINDFTNTKCQLSRIDQPINSSGGSDYCGKVNFEEAVAASCLAEEAIGLHYNKSKKIEFTGFFLFFWSLLVAAQLRETKSGSPSNKQALLDLPKGNINSYRKAISKDNGLLGEKVAEVIVQGLKVKYSKHINSTLITQGVELAAELYKGYLKEAQKNSK